MIRTSSNAVPGQSMPRRSRRSRLTAAILTLLLLAAGGASAQSGLASRPITGVEFQGLRLLSEETLLFYLGLQVGSVLDQELLDQKIRELWDKGLLDDITVDGTPDGDGVRLTVRLVERPVLRSVEYVGLKRLSRTDIDDRMATERIDLREGFPVDLGELQRTKVLIEEMYQEKGFRFAQVQINLEEIEPGERRATYTVDEGDKVRIGDIQFEGNEVFSDIRLRLSMRKTKESGPISRILKHDIYNPATLEEDLDKVRTLYRGDGYKNVLLGEPRLDVIEDGSKRRLALIIPVEEGERWRFGEVVVEGNDQITDEGVEGIIEHKEGGWLQADKLEEAVTKIEEAYKNRGYIFARIRQELIEREGYVADLKITVEENEQFRVGRVEFEGNTSTRDKVLRRELRVAEGRFINLGAVRNSVFKINQLGFFEVDKDEPVKFDPDTEEKEVNLTFKGVESNRTQLQFGAGYSELDGFFGQAAISTNNFLGRGETIGLSVQTGGTQDVFDASYFIPWFLDRPQTIGFQAFQQSYDFELGTQEFERESEGGIVTYGRNFRLFQSFSISYNLSRFRDRVTNFTDDGPTPVSLIEIDNSSIRPVWQFNSVDNRFEPTVGQRLRVSAEYAGGFLGGDNWFVRPEIGYTLFKPLTRFPLRTVLGLNFQAGLIDPFGTVTNATTGERQDRGLSPLERYFLGGENSVRGHRTRSIFVRDDDGNPVIDPTFGTFGFGGDKFFTVSLEYHFLLGGPFRLISFVDGGNVYGDYLDADGNLIEQGFDLENLRWTAGLELRVLVPVFGAPLRFIYAFNLDELPGDEFDSFRFSIGTSF